MNGLLGVSKGDWSGEIEVHRLIMNLIPLNRICRGIEGDIATLPSWSSMGPLSLGIEEDLLISSEGVRCFFYIFKVPLSLTRLRARFDIARVEIGSAFVLRVSFCWCFKGEPKGTMVHKAKTPPKGRRTFREQS